MANKKQETFEVTTLKPAETTAFEPIYELDSVEGRTKAGGDYIHIGFRPVSGGASAIGTIIARCPASLAPGTPLAAIAALVGQDPAKGFNAAKAKGTRLRLSFTRLEAPKESK